MRKGINKLFVRNNMNDSSLVLEMEHVVKLTEDTSKRKLGSPFHGLPNVSSVKIELSPWSEIMKSFGIDKRLGKATMIYKKYQNNGANRYAVYMIGRLKRSTSERKYGIIVDMLLKRSVIFFYLAAKHVFPNLHRDMPFGDFVKLYRDYLKLVIDPKDIDFKRVYIEKGEGKFRPLGVPKPVGRLYLHLLNQFLTIKFDPTISESQHGFRPGRGTMTAGVEVLKSLDRYRYIYEFDYKGFFNGLEITKISEMLERRKVPKEWIHRIENLNKSQPKLTKIDKVDEFKARQYEYISMCLETETAPSGMYGEPIRQTIIDAFGTDNPRESELLGSCLLEGVGEYGTLQDLLNRPNVVLLKYVETQGALLASFGIGAFYTMLCGVPQGAPTSPFLSILLLNDVCEDDKQEYKIIRYADDGLIFSNKPLKLLETEKMKEAGIEYAQEKCRTIMEKGKQVAPMKFLGIKGGEGKLTADTRKGSKLEYDKESLLEAMASGHIKRGYTGKAGDFNAFIQSSLKGFIMSRLYTGTGNLDNYIQDFKLKYEQGSGVGHYIKGLERIKTKDPLLEKLVGVKLTVFNSSSICIPFLLDALSQIRDNKKIKIRGISSNRKV